MTWPARTAADAAIGAAQTRKTASPDRLTRDREYHEGVSVSTLSVGLGPMTAWSHDRGWEALSYTSVEVCAGAGGQAVGLEAAGFEHLGCVEIEHAACATRRHKRPTWNVIEADVRTWKSDRSLRGVDLLAGAVPCPPFSIAGRQLGADDDRDLFPAMLSFLRQLEPRVAMIENVRGPRRVSPRFPSWRSQAG
jgi:C-5 cytosine-specific DNA methylase